MAKAFRTTRWSQHKGNELEQIIRRAAGPLALISCALLAACGALPSYQAASNYRAWQSKEVAGQLTECLAEREASLKLAGAKTAPSQDCFLTLVDSSTRRLDKAGRVPGSPLPNEPDVSKPASVDLYPALALDGARSAEEVVSQVGWMAMLAKMVYRRHVDESMRNLPDKACDYTNHPLERLNAAEKAARKPKSRWEQWFKEGSDNKPVGCLADGGLFYETFVYRDAATGAATDAVIVFRGTESFGDQTRQDWAANLSAPLNRTPAQYVVVRRELPRLIEELKRAEKGPLKIYTAGHSLGGGLAQLSAYMSADIIAAYAFNTSPVTGWTWLQGLKQEDPRAVAVEDPQIIRVSQDDEALGLVRLFTNAANSTVRRSGRTDVVFDFPSSRAAVEASKKTGRFGAGAELHSITLLACNLAARIAHYPDEGAFHFTQKMAEAAVAEATDSHTSVGLDVEGLCQVRIEDSCCSVDWFSRKASCVGRGEVLRTATGGNEAMCKRR